MKPLHLLPILAAACSGDPQIVLELTGSASGADRVEVLLLDPLVIAKRQLHNDLQQSTADRLETVFYMAERSRTTFELQGTLTDGLQFEVQGAGGPYVPLVAARAGDQVLALGLYNPPSVFAAELGREHAPDAVSSVKDVTIYPIELEPVSRAFAATATPQPVRLGEVMAVPCGASGEMSGLVWRRADLRQLRVLLAIASRPEGAQGLVGKDLLDPPDLDCDHHTPGPAGVLRISVGDERDCDDTSSAVNGEARERCSAFDEDCNSLTTLSPTPCAEPGACLAPGCLCDDMAGPNSNICPMPISAPCTLPSSSSGGTGLLPCESAGFVQLPPCQLGCEVIIDTVPDGMEVVISDEIADSAQGPGKWVQLADDKAWLSVKGATSFASPDQMITVRIKTAAGTSAPLAIVLKLFSGECRDPSLLACPTL